MNRDAWVKILVLACSAFSACLCGGCAETGGQSARMRDSLAIAKARRDAASKENDGKTVMVTLCNGETIGYGGSVNKVIWFLWGEVYEALGDVANGRRSLPILVSPVVGEADDGTILFLGRWLNDTVSAKSIVLELEGESEQIEIALAGPGIPEVEARSLFFRYTLNEFDQSDPVSKALHTNRGKPIRTFLTMQSGKRIEGGKVVWMEDLPPWPDSDKQPDGAGTRPEREATSPAAHR